MFFKKPTIITAAFALVLIATTGTALGQFTSTLDSADFTWKYEMDVDPTDQASIDLDSNGFADWSYNNSTPATLDAGIATLSSSTLLMSGSETTDLWPAAGFTGTEGFTYEIKLKTVDGTAGQIVSSFIACMSDRDDYGMFAVKPDGQNWIGGASTASDNYSDFHAYRVARSADADGGLWWLWRDGDLITQGGAANTGELANLDRFYFGTGISGSYTGSLEVDYVRLTEGAHQPIVPTYTPPTTIKNAPDFDLVYNMDVDPTDPTAIDLDDDGIADWITSTGSTPVSIDSPGILTISDSATLRSGTMNGEVNEGIWPSQSFTAAAGFTYEISMQAVQSEGVSYTNTIVIALSDSPEATGVFIGADRIRWGAEDILTDIDNSDGQHKFRISRDSDANGGRWWLWRDGELIGENGHASSNIIAGLDAIYFGPAVSGSSAGTAYVDYVSLTDGSFAPEIVTYIPGDANHDGIVNDLDAEALADNWQMQGGATWAMGDFNDDGNVDDIDATILASNWQAGSAASVPEPGCLILLAGCLIAFLIRRR